MYITLKTGKNKCELWLTTERNIKSQRTEAGAGGKRKEKRKEKSPTGANPGEMDINVTSDSEHNFSFQP